MIGDVEGHDYLCAHYGNHANTKCLCQECDCLTDDADDLNVICNFIKASQLKLHHDTNNIIQLKSMSFHNVRNAFDKVCFGANEYGINFATMMEVLHALQKHLYLYALSGF